MGPTPHLAAAPAAPSSRPLVSALRRMICSARDQDGPNPAFGQEITRLHVQLSAVEVRLGTSAERRCDLARARHLAHELRGRLMAWLLLEEIRCADGHAA